MNWDEFQEWDKRHFLSRDGGTDEPEGFIFIEFHRRMAPQERYLSFHREFLNGCAQDAAPNMGTYCNGWEL